MVRSFLLVVITAVAALVGCGKKNASAPSAEVTADNAPAQVAREAVITPTSATRARPPEPKPVDPLVVLHTSLGDIKLQLFREKSPRTVENFLRGYAERGYYDQTIFHHAEPGAMLIAGGYTAELARKPARSPIYNESRNGLANRRATVAMIREPDAPHSATSEFFINLADNSSFDFQAGKDEEEDQFGYCVFGEVIGGMEIVDRIAQQETTAQGDFAKIPSPFATILSIERLQ